MSKMGAINSDTDPDTVTILHRRGPMQKTLRTAAVCIINGFVISCRATLYYFLSVSLVTITRLGKQYCMLSI